MKGIFECIQQHSAKPSPWLERLAGIFNAMDAGYEQVAGRHGFVCRGCEDNCCRTRFYHHTLLEYTALYRGYALLPVDEKQRAVERASEYCRRHTEADAAGTRVQPWCPLNENGRCLSYDVRPMICRLHGIPHVLQQAGGRVVQGPACAYFESNHELENNPPLDRTPFYKAMAELEKSFRSALGVNVKFKQTIAEMILSFRTGDRGSSHGGNS